VPDAGRVVSGSARGIRLQAPGSGTRTLSDRVKQALFGTLESEGVLGPDDAFLDLFAGSGAAGIEALSRGARRAVFVERDPPTCAVIEANLRRAGLPMGAVVRADVLRFLETAPDACGGPFSACVADPPYAQPLLAPTLDRLGDAGRGWLTAGAIVVTKHFWRDSPPPAAGELSAYRERRFGETMLTFYRRGERPQPPDHAQEDT
jgi:16S rRNA (guanine966-N2)-methyltransferase